MSAAGSDGRGVRHLAALRCFARALRGAEAARCPGPLQPASVCPALPPPHAGPQGRSGRCEVVCPCFEAERAVACPWVTRGLRHVAPRGTRAAVRRRPFCRVNGRATVCEAGSANRRTSLYPIKRGSVRKAAGQEFMFSPESLSGPGHRGSRCASGHARVGETALTRQTKGRARESSEETSPPSELIIF